jgi:uncharacterized damage-inducible protein DinB
MTQPTATSTAVASPAPVANVEAARLADQLERSFRGGAWHGPALLQAVDGVDAALATSRPIGAAHTIHELVWHAAFWLDVGRQRIEGVPPQALGPDADWPATDGDAAALWRDALDRLEAAHRGLHALVSSLPDARLEDPVTGSDPSVRGLLLGLVQHNAYHAGQIVLLRKAGAGR